MFNSLTQRISQKIRGITFLCEHSSLKKVLIKLTLLLLLLFTTILVLGYFNSRELSNDLRGIYITDLKDRSAVVSWVTAKPQKTELLYSTQDNITLFSQFTNSKVGYDRRDLEEVGEFEYKLKTRGKYYVHSVVLRDLEPETEYIFSIKSGLFLNNSNYINRFTTTALGETINTPDVAYGNIFNQNEELISDTLLLFELTNSDFSYKSQQISYVMDGNTGWSADLENLLQSNLEEPYEKPQDIYLNIHIINSKGNTLKTVNYNNIKPVENISAYDNFSEEDLHDSSVKGFFTKIVNANTTSSALLDCENSGGTWNADTGKCVCIQDGYYLVDGKCQKYVCTTNHTADCNCNCKSGYSSTKPSSGYYETDIVNCPSKDLCRVSCGNPYSITCYKEVEQPPSCSYLSCSSCSPTCPPAAFPKYTESVNTGELSQKSYCMRIDNCGDPCGKGEITCYLPKTITPEEPPRERTQAECDYYDIDERQAYHWCECTNGVESKCMGSIELRDNHSGSCLTYCENIKKETFVKTKFCGSGELSNCLYGCDQRGPQEDDICKPKPSVLGQETYCSKITTQLGCESTEGICFWVSGSCRADYAPGIVKCSDLTTHYSCGLVYGCEYVNGICRTAQVSVSTNNEELDTSGYINLLQSDICTGVNIGGSVAKVTQGTNMEGTSVTGSYHVKQSSCAIDLSTPVGTPLWNGQIPGLSIEGLSLVWEEGYTCVSGSGGGFGNYIDVTQPNGQVIRYAHLSSTSCSSVISGATGNSDPGGHLHIEVRVGDGDTGGCLGNTNPCKYVAGGCYFCDSRPWGVALSDEDSPGSYKKDGFNFVSKTFAQETWPDAKNFVLDQDIKEGVYGVVYGSTSKTTGFVKTDDNHIVFFEDTNGNGILDEGERILSPLEAQYKYGVIYSKIADVYRLVLQEGLNLISFPVIFTTSSGNEIKRASELISYLNNGGANITSLVAYRSGRFIIYANRNGQVFGDDFNILPGEGYFVTSLTQGVYLYSGNKVENSLEIQLFEGWNLVNIYNSTIPSFSGFDLLKKMQSNSLNASTISKWEDGGYTSIVSSEGNDYGLDFRIYPTRAYFVRIREGKGTFKPN